LKITKGKSEAVNRRIYNTMQKGRRGELMQKAKD